jgi:hypothetical protein
MSSKNNVNPDHYKIAGRERQGEYIVHDLHKRRYKQSKAGAGARRRNFIPGAGPGAGEENLSEVAQKADEAKQQGRTAGNGQ